MIENKINKKQTKLTWDGVKYKAVVEDRGVCSGCAFYAFPATGVASLPCPDVPHDGGYRSPHCTAGARVDGQSIIWVKRKNQPTQGE